MEYIKRTVRSKPGLSQEDALSSLQEHPQFRVGTKISSIRRRSNRWVAELLEPKTAEFPPGDDDGTDAVPKAPKAEESADGFDGPDDSGDDGSDDGAPEGPPSDGEDGEHKDRGGEKGELKQVLHMLQGITEALGITPDPAAGDMGGPDDMGPGMGGPGGPPPGGPPHGGPGGPPMPPPGAGGPPGSMGKNPGQLPTKLQPGEVLPHQTPVGAPAFASVRQAHPGDPNAPMAPGGGVVDPTLNPQVAPNAPVPAGNPMLPDPNDPNAQMQPGMQGIDPALLQQLMPGQAQQAQGIMASTQRVASFTASKYDPQQQVTTKQARLNLEASYPGYRVRQIRRDQQGYLRALLSVR